MFDMNTLFKTGAAVFVSIITISNLAGCAGNPTPTTVVSSDATSYAVTSTNGLTLKLSINSTTYKTGDTVFILVDEFNTKKTANDVSTDNAVGWPVQGLNLDQNYTTRYPYPVGISILQGDFNLSDANTVQPLVLINPDEIRYGLPIPVVSSYDFQSLSDLATLQFKDNSVKGQVILPITGTVTANGFWKTGSSGNGGFSAFTPGIYTVIGGDEWGGIAILHFSIS
jgi:hypothetical protein